MPSKELEERKITRGKKMRWSSYRQSHKAEACDPDETLIRKIPRGPFERDAELTVLSAG